MLRDAQLSTFEHSARIGVRVVESSIPLFDKRYSKKHGLRCMGIIYGAPVIS